MLWMQIQCYICTDQDDMIIDWNTLWNIELKGQDLAGFVESWEFLLARLHFAPDMDVLEGIFKKQIQKYTGLKHSIQLYEDRIEQGVAKRDYDYLHDLVMKRLTRLDLERAAEERRKALGMKNPGGGNALPAQGGEGQKVRLCPQWSKSGTCTNQNCPHSHYKNDRGASTPPALAAKGGGRRV